MCRSEINRDRKHDHMSLFHRARKWASWPEAVRRGRPAQNRGERPGAASTQILPPHGMKCKRHGQVYHIVCNFSTVFFFTKSSQSIPNHTIHNVDFSIRSCISQRLRKNQRRDLSIHSVAVFVSLIFFTTSHLSARSVIPQRLLFRHGLSIHMVRHRNPLSTGTSSTIYARSVATQSLTTIPAHQLYKVLAFNPLNVITKSPISTRSSMPQRLTIQRAR